MCVLFGLFALFGNCGENGVLCFIFALFGKSGETGDLHTQVLLS